MGEDDEAVARVRAGDQEGFRTLVERHSRSLFRLAYRMTGNEPDAEDVVQESFLRAYQRLHQFEARANFGSWLYRIATNCAYDLLRARRRREREEEPVPFGPDEEGIDLPLPAPDPSPDRLAMSAEVRRRVNAAMSRMSPRERAAFVLRHFEGMSILEIGRTLELEESATKQSIFRAVRKLRVVLAPAAGAAP
jgi:RNA polymerase sigma-70 factor, ECF subfamily